MGFSVHRLVVLARYLGLFFLFAANVALAATASAPPAAVEATLTVANRTVATFRTNFSGATPEVRAARAERRIKELGDQGVTPEVELVPYSVDGTMGIAIRAGDQILFALSPGDLDPEASLSLNDTAEESAKQVREVLQAYQEQTTPRMLLRGILLTLLATAIAWGLLWLLLQIGRRVTARVALQLERRLEKTRGVGWARYTYGLILRVAQLVLLVVALFVLDLWLTFVLKQFPITAPLGDHLIEYLFVYAAHFGEAMLGALPGLVAIAIIVVISQAIAGVVRSVFDAAQSGNISLPGIHPETASATRRIVICGVWAFAFALCYPYIPGSNSDVFKGVSVLLGFLLTLGSAGVVSQLMGGLVLTYSRALRVGDYVRIGEVEGVVQELSTLSIKIVNVRNEEITIPNAALVSSAIYNYSKRATSQGTMLSTKVTIGYDAPWRQIHALLIEAAHRVPDIRDTPEPYVYQRALNDFYVEYELFCQISEAKQRVPILSKLHGAIQDCFNEYGVQIMSPHFFSQPSQAVLSPKEQWFAAPARSAEESAPAA
ncbi:mechanosensitive ion channel [Niveibacterium umoris]|uniref:Small-conductance mechanosensitive channel n=1 Tax=Niveibacterium umoris TaxID=1193620 RepID=A0A840BK07_9RHOO|nr:mechanosensitive ion channel domain-containing protein [Niveibacterium umoris]MBB4011942.1 small-conductance mechanosensitive channel [Niveibacterium umoris]